MSNRVTDAEFQKLKDIRAEAIDIATSLGELIYQKIVIDSQIEEQAERVRELREKEAQFFENLKSQYGNVMIDIETGVIKPAVLQ